MWLLKEETYQSLQWLLVLVLVNFEFLWCIHYVLYTFIIGVISSVGGVWKGLADRMNVSSEMPLHFTNCSYTLGGELLYLLRHSWVYGLSWILINIIITILHLKIQNEYHSYHRLYELWKLYKGFLWKWHINILQLMYLYVWFCDIKIFAIFSFYC